MQPDDLGRLHTVADPQVHPDGDRIAVVVSTPDVEDDTYVRRIHVWTEGAGAPAFTHGPKDGSPRWSPDGSHLAFIRTGEADDAQPQLAVMPAAGGEARTLTDLPLGIGDLAWTPDGAAVVVVGTEWIADLTDLDDDERRRRPRRITRIPYRADDEGWTHDRRSHLWLVPLDGTAPRCLTPGDHDEAAPAVRPDGRAVVFTSERSPHREVDPVAEVYEVPLDGGTTTQLLGPGGWDRPVPLADGQLLVGGHRDPFEWPAPTGLFRVTADGELADLTGGLDRDVVGRPVVTDGGHLALVEDRGRVGVRRFTGDGPPEVVVGGDRTVTGVSATPDGRVVAFTADAVDDPGELWRLVDGREERLTDFNADLREHGRLVPTEHLVFERDGIELDAWVLLPESPAEDVPLLLNIHGGPTSQYGFTFFDEFQVYAAAGYAVVGINPRGSSGRGAEWATAVVGTWTDPGSVDVLDLESVVDAVLDRYPQVSRTRLGIMGGSYGGYATARILPRTDRFSSAVVERGLLSWVSFGGTSDIGAFFDRMFMRRTLPADAADLWAASPVSTADRITTPTLVLHSEQDHRCPIEQAELFFSILRRNGVEAELLRFPGEGHELSRSGSPRHRVERFDAILEWHGRHLGVADG